MVTTHAETDIAQVWQDYRAQPAVDLRNRLLEHYLPLVKYNAERIWARLPDGVELDDLMSAGVFGLMDAVDAFDLSRGVKFETYCVPRIRGAMLDELRTMDWVPRLVRSKQSKVEVARKALEAEMGRPPRPEELAVKLGVPLDQIDSFVGEATAANLVSLNKKWYETDSYKDVREIDILEDKKAEDPTGRLQNRDLMRLVTRGLNRNERLIVILYYYEEMTMKEIGATLNLSESRVSQMHSSIVARLQAQLCKRRPEFSNYPDCPSARKMKARGWVFPRGPILFSLRSLLAVCPCADYSLGWRFCSSRLPFRLNHRNCPLTQVHERAVFLTWPTLSIRLPPRKRSPGRS